MSNGARRALAALAVALLVPLLAVGVDVASAPAAHARSLLPFSGLGVWVDRFDWSVTHGGAVPAVGLDDIDRMAAEGATTLYIQTATPGSADILERPRLQSLVDRAHARGMSVVGWHLPKLVDPAADLSSLLAMRSLGVDAIGVDIEDLSVGDVAERNRRLVALSRDLRAAAPDVTLSAIVLPPVVTDVLNLSYWPDFPWRQLDPYYDVWQPMGYWTNRTPGTIYRDGYRYTAENIDRLRSNIGRDVPVAPVGGLSDKASPEEVQGFVLASAERGALGISLYDWSIHRADLWPVMRLSGGEPFGAVDQVLAGSGSATVSGWALDPDTAQPIDVHVYVDGVGKANVVADLSRPDVAARYPDWGPGHGFRAVAEGLAPGPHEVCAYAISRGRGGNVALGCQRVVVPSGSPIGRLEAADGTVRSIRASGWALDPDSGDPIDVHLYVDGAGRANVRADRYRGDVNAHYPAWGGDVGYSVELGDLDPGVHQVCAYGINVGAGSNVLLGCHLSVVPASPFGFIEAVRPIGPRTVRVSGWAVDPDTPGPIDVHLYVDGRGRANIPTDRPRADLAARWPSLGDRHGFAADIGPLAPGAHQVCAYGINRNQGGNALIGCRSFNVPGGSPLGRVEAARAGPRSVMVTGWALDPDQASPAAVHVYVDGVGRANQRASRPRADVAAAFPGYGPDHGFAIAVDGLAPGAHTVCAYAVDPLRPAEVSLMGCPVVTVPGGHPRGAVDRVAPAGSGAVDLWGWALDPDSAGPVDIHIYVDGVGYGTGVADRSRPDVGRVYPAWGPDHGFELTLQGLAPGVRDVCVFAIDRAAPGPNALLRCEPVVVLP